MSNRIIGFLCAIFAATVTLSVSTDADAGRHKYKSLYRAESFAMSIEYTGYIGGDMRIGGVFYRLAKNAPVYVIGEGILSRKISVNKRYVYLAGDKSGREGVIHTIIVRPVAAEGGQSGDVHELPANTPG